MEEIARSIAIVASGLLAGIMVTAAIIVHPAIAELDQAPGKVVQFQGSKVGWWLGPRLGFTAGVAMVLSLIFGKDSDAEVAMSGAGIAAFAVAVALTVRYEGPERAMRELPVGSPVEVFRATLRPMRNIHKARTVFFVLAFVCIAVAGELH